MAWWKDENIQLRDTWTGLLPSAWLARIQSPAERNENMYQQYIDPGIFGRWHSISAKGLLWINRFKTYLICQSLFSPLKK